MTCERLRLKGLIYRPPKTNRYFVTPYGWKVARLFSRLEARVFRPAMAMFTAMKAANSTDPAKYLPLLAKTDMQGVTTNHLAYDAKGEKVGYIERVMIDKISGKVSYAVLSFGGLLGIGDDHYPLPWQTLKYDTNLGGYVVTGISQDQLRGAPKYADESSWNWSDPATTRSVNAYYGVPVA